MIKEGLAVLYMIYALVGIFVSILRREAFGPDARADLILWIGAYALFWPLMWALDL